MNKVDYFQAIKLPFTDPKKLIIGVLLSLPIPIVNFITNTVVSGYALYCGKSAYEGKREMPDWQNWLNLWLKGFIAGIISLAYIIPAIVSFFTFAGGMMADLQNSTRFGLLTVALNFLLNPFGMVGTYGVPIFIPWSFTVLALYLIPIATLSYVIENKIGSAFDFRGLFKMAFTKTYFVAWLILFLIGYGTAYVSSIFPGFLTAGGDITVAIIFLAISTFGSFIIDVFRNTLFGEVLAELKNRPT